MTVPAGGDAKAAADAAQTRPTQVRPTANDRLPQALCSYVRQSGGAHLLCLAALAVLLAGLAVLPIEAMRRAIDGLVQAGVQGGAQGEMLVSVLLLAAIYGALALAELGLRLALDFYRGWIAQRMTARLRQQVTTRIEARWHQGARVITSATSPATAIEGIEPRLVLTDVAQLGEQLGANLLLPLRRGALLVAVLAYLLHLHWLMGLAVLLLLVPQLLVQSLIQQAIRRREHQLSRLSAAVTLNRPGFGAAPAGDLALAPADGGKDNRVMRVAKLQAGLARLQHLPAFVTSLTRHLGFAVLLAMGGWLTLTGRMGGAAGQVSAPGIVIAALFGFAKIADIGREITLWRRDRDRGEVKYRQIRDAVAWLARAA